MAKTELQTIALAGKIFRRSGHPIEWAVAQGPQPLKTDPQTFEILKSGKWQKSFKKRG